jgi:hypothetical protein
MALKREFIRGQNREIIGSVTTGYVGSVDTVVRDESNHIIGWSSEKFHTTRDEHGNLISTNSADPGLLIGKNNRR